jgi:hypothetical protein
MSDRAGFRAARRAAAFLASSALWPAIFLSASVTACSSTSSGTDAGSTGPKGNVVLRDVNNYTSQSTLTIPRVSTAPGADLDICWGDISKDILCHALAPAMDIDNVSFLQILNLTEDQIAAKLAAGQLPTANVKTYRDFHVDHALGSTCVKLSALSLGATPIAPATDYAAGDDKKYMLLFSKGTTPGSGSRTMMFIEPDATSAVAAVAAPDGCGILQFTADLTTPTPLAIPIAGPWVVDWSQITHDGMGNGVLFQNIDGLLVGFYAGMTVAELQARFLDIDMIATSLYKIVIPKGVKNADLATATTASGEVFPGFGRTDGVWAVGLTCSQCQVPAPVALSIFAPTAD